MRLFALFLACLCAASAYGQTIHQESENFSLASPVCTTAPSVSFPAACIQQTGDTAPPAIGNQKVILQAGAIFDYAIVVPTTGVYQLTVRLNGLETVHFEAPVGFNVSAAIVNPGSLGTFTAPKLLSLTQGPMSLRMVVETVGSGYPSANWFELTFQKPLLPAISLSATLSWDDKTPIAGGVTIAQMIGSTNTTLQSFALDSTGSLAGPITVDTTQPEPLTLTFVLTDPQGNTVGSITQVVPKAIFAGVTKCIGSLTLSKSTLALKGYTWASQ